MRHKLALAIALAGFMGATAFGVGMAGAEPVIFNEGIGRQGAALGPSVEAATDPAGECPDPAVADVVREEPATEEVDCEVRDQPQPQPTKGGVVQGEGLDAADAGAANGGVVAPPAPGATGGGDQPQEASDGGSQFSDGGSPTPDNPSATIAPFGPAPIGVPNFVIDSFEIPPFLLPIYQACGTEYGIPWEVLASINKIETAFGTNLNVSSAGAMGWMQFMPPTWEAYGVDANGDGRKDPYNPVDAICAAANYLKASGGADDLYNAIFAYNHADWYVQEVLLYARAYGKLPSDLVGSLSGLTEGAHFPVAADARYADDIATREALRRATPDEREEYGNAAEVVSSSPTRRGINIFAAQDAPVVAVNDGKIEKMGRSEKLGRFVVLQDAYGNSYTYAKLGKIVREGRTVVTPTGAERRIPVDTQNIRPRLRALPGRGEDEPAARAEVVDYAAAVGADGTLRVGSRVIAGTVLGRIGAGEDGVDPHINFSIRPAGRGAPRIDPKPILDGWKLLEATAIYRAKGKSPFARKLGSAGVLLLSKSALERRVLADEQVELPSCDLSLIRGGQVDRRVLATLAYLSEQGFRLTVTSMLCGRQGSITTSGNVSNHSFGNAVDIAAINGIPVLGNQQPGSVTVELLKSVLRLQGTLRPDELISLHTLGGPSFAMADHADHVHIGWSPYFGEAGGEARFVQLLKPDQWLRLTDRLSEIDNPRVRVHSPER